MKSAFVLAMVLAAGLSASAPASASHDTGFCTVTSSTPDAEVAGYALFRDTGSVRLYQETNGLPGIQRSDPVKTDTNCFHGSDTVVASAPTTVPHVCLPNIGLGQICLF